MLVEVLVLVLVEVLVVVLVEVLVVVLVEVLVLVLVLVVVLVEVLVVVLVEVLVLVLVDVLVVVVVSSLQQDHAMAKSLMPFTLASPGISGAAMHTSPLLRFQVVHSDTLPLASQVRPSMS